MKFMEPADRILAEAASGLIYTNPFMPEWVEYERRALGDDRLGTGPVWNPRSGGDLERSTLEEVTRHAEEVAGMLRGRIAERPAPPPAEMALYEDLIVFVLYQRYSRPLLELANRCIEGQRTGPIDFYAGFSSDARHFLAVGGWSSPLLGELPHLFALFFQVRRAFELIFWQVVGGSLPTARLRAAIWQSIFTRDVRRYRRALYARMGELTTLVTGASGTGKELVARAIALSRYLSFDERSRKFAGDLSTAFCPLNLSALSPTLIESELFGHVRGAFTGAVSERNGWLGTCQAEGTVFLDEIGELSPAIQVKLLRVLETRRFQRLGESVERRFEGKLIAATNRDLPDEIAAGRFRADLYYRLCSDTVHTPSLAEQLADAPGEMENLVHHLAVQVVGADEADRLTAEVMDHIDTRLGDDYPWPGNIREVTQCVRNVLIRGEYRPAAMARTKAGGALDELAREVVDGKLTADAMLSRYVTLVYSRAGGYEEAARRLDLDGRTVKARVDESFLGRLRLDG